MPDMNGKVFAEEVLHHRPDAGIIFMSGYLSEMFFIRNSNRKRLAFLKKPFTLKELAEKVKHVVAAAQQLM